MNSQQVTFKVGDCVAHVLPNGKELEEGVITSIGGRFVEVLFDNEERPKNIEAYKLKKI